MGLYSELAEPWPPPSPVVAGSLMLIGSELGPAARTGALAASGSSWSPGEGSGCSTKLSSRIACQPAERDEANWRRLISAWLSPPTSGASVKAKEDVPVVSMRPAVRMDMEAVVILMASPMLRLHRSCSPPSWWAASFGCDMLLSSSPFPFPVAGFVLALVGLGGRPLRRTWSSRSASGERLGSPIDMAVTLASILAAVVVRVVVGAAGRVGAGSVSLISRRLGALASTTLPPSSSPAAVVAQLGGLFKSDDLAASGNTLVSCKAMAVSGLGATRPSALAARRPPGPHPPADKSVRPSRAKWPRGRRAWPAPPLAGSGQASLAGGPSRRRGVESRSWLLRWSMEAVAILIL